MASINHSVVMKTTKEKLIESLTTLEGLGSWWTTEVSGSTELGGVIEFRFGNPGFNMKVVESSDSNVAWKVIEGPDEWMGTPVNFEIRSHDEGIILYFSHSEWNKESDFHHHCSMKWATFLLSLKNYLEKGIGNPFPQDIRI